MVPFIGSGVFCGGTNRKCSTGEYDVTDRAACEQDAKDNGHEFYQYVEEFKMCFTVASCDDIIEGTSWDWRIYGEGCGIFHNFSLFFNLFACYFFKIFAFCYLFPKSFKIGWNLKCYVSVMTFLILLSYSERSKILAFSTRNRQSFDFKSWFFCHFCFFFQKTIFLRNRPPPKYHQFFFKSLRQKVIILQHLECRHGSSLNKGDTSNFKITLKNTIKFQMLYSKAYKQ